MTFTPKNKNWFKDPKLDSCLKYDQDNKLQEFDLDACRAIVPDILDRFKWSAKNQTIIDRFKKFHPHVTLWYLLKCKQTLDGLEWRLLDESEIDWALPIYIRENYHDWPAYKKLSKFPRFSFWKFFAKEFDLESWDTLRDDRKKEYITTSRDQAILIAIALHLDRKNIGLLNLHAYHREAFDLNTEDRMDYWTAYIKNRKYYDHKVSETCYLGDIDPVVSEAGEWFENYLKSRELL